MKANSVSYIGFVQDHSGSMCGKTELAINNFNEQLFKLLKEDDETMDNIVSIVEFDDIIHCNIDGVPISEIKKLENWWTGGATALYDAIAHCIDIVKMKMKADKREDKAALIIVQTDGEENDSKKYKGEIGRQKINELINELEDTKKWSFVFLGENIDKKVAMDLGFKTRNIMSHGSDHDEVRTAYYASTAGLDSYMKARKLGDTQTMSFYSDNKTDEDPGSPFTVNNSGDIK